jgi:hypothetical protein
MVLLGSGIFISPITRKQPTLEMTWAKTGNMQATDSEEPF